jgi:hypothetical protein
MKRTLTDALMGPAPKRRKLEEQKTEAPADQPFLTGDVETDIEFAKTFLTGQTLLMFSLISPCHHAHIKVDVRVVAAFDIGRRRLPGCIVGFIPDPPPPKAPRLAPAAPKRKRGEDGELIGPPPPKKKYTKPEPTGFVRVISARQFDLDAGHVSLRYNFGERATMRPYTGANPTRTDGEDGAAALFQTLGREISSWEELYLNRAPLTPVFTESQKDQLKGAAAAGPIMFAIGKAIFAAIAACDAEHGCGDPHRIMAHAIGKDGVKRGSEYTVHKQEAEDRMIAEFTKQGDKGALRMLDVLKLGKWKLDDMADAFGLALKRAKAGEGRIGGL